MSNSLYDSARQKFLEAGINWTTDNIKVALLAGTYTGGSQAITTDEFYSAIADHILTGTVTVKSLSGKATVNGSSKGVAIADPVTFNAVAANQTIAYIAIFKDTDSTIDGAPASPSTAPLIALFDSGYGIGAGTNGGNIRITWDAVNGIFQI